MKVMEENGIVGGGPFTPTDRHRDVIGRLEERHRLLTKQKMPTMDQLEETPAQFYARFNDLRKDVESRLEKAQSGVEVDEACTILQRMQKALLDASHFLPAYDLRRSQETLAQLQRIRDSTEARVRPKKRFGFRSRALSKPLREIQAEEQKQISKDSAVLEQLPDGEKPDNSLEASVMVRARKGETVRLSRKELMGQDVLLHELVGCTVVMEGVPAAVQAVSLVDCHILCGPVASSIMVEACSGCTMSIAAHQIRIHSSQNCDMYVAVTSRTVMENSSGIRFAPNTWRYPKIEEDAASSGLDLQTATQRWMCVDDFGWPATQCQSPNWSPLLEEDRVNHWDDT